MTAHVLISGTLFREPERRTSKAGKPFVTSTIKVKDGDTLQFWRVIAFTEGVRAELTRLTDGDALSVQGALKTETYEKDGETKLSLTVLADHVLALRQPRSRREQISSGTADGRPASRRQRREPEAEKAEIPFDDAVPF